MCVRFDQYQILKKLEKAVPIKGAIELPNRYNIGIGDQAAIITNNHGYEWNTGRFSLKRFWGGKSTVLYNARVEGDLNPTDEEYEGPCGIFDKKTYKDLMDNRCIIPVNAFYEGPRGPGLKNPYRFHPLSGQPMFFAGIYEDYQKDDGTTERGFIILTTTPYPQVAAIGHHRSPLVLNEELMEGWLDNGLVWQENEDDRFILEGIMKGRYFPEDIETYPIAPDAMKKRQSLEPLPVAGDLGLFNGN